MQEMVDDEKKIQTCDFLTSVHIDIAGRPSHPPTVYVISLWNSDKQPGLSSGLPSWRIIYVPRYVTAVQYRGLGCRTEYKRLELYVIST